MLANLHRSLLAAPRPVYLIYHNPVHQDIVDAQNWLQEFARTQYFVVYKAAMGE
jgi:hypothetical protein